jgi:CRISPR-associated endoribonuclease Cas2
MRLVLFFDLPIEKKEQRRDYTRFVKNIKKFGFYMLQESVYVKLCIDNQNSDFTIMKVKSVKPKDGSVFILTITEKQFSNINIILGSKITDVIDNDERLVIL